MRDDVVDALAALEDIAEEQVAGAGGSNRVPAYIDSGGTGSGDATTKDLQARRIDGEEL